MDVTGNSVLKELFVLTRLSITELSLHKIISNYSQRGVFWGLGIYFFGLVGNYRSENGL